MQGNKRSPFFEKLFHPVFSFQAGVCLAWLYRLVSVDRSISTLQTSLPALALGFSRFPPFGTVTLVNRVSALGQRAKRGCLDDIDGDGLHRISSCKSIARGFSTQVGFRRHTSMLPFLRSSPHASTTVASCSPVPGPPPGRPSLSPRANSKSVTLPQHQRRGKQ